VVVGDVVDEVVAVVVVVCAPATPTCHRAKTVPMPTPRTEVRRTRAPYTASHEQWSRAHTRRDAGLRGRSSVGVLCCQRGCVRGARRAKRVGPPPPAEMLPTRAGLSARVIEVPG